MIWFVLGLFLGATVTFAIMCCMIVGKREDERMER